MNEFLKGRRPRLTEDEERRLWQRVRTIPREVDEAGQGAGAARPASGRAPWWRAWTTMPAVRYGVPALAVLLVAVVWVLQRPPAAPVRPAAPAGPVATTESTAPAPATTGVPEPLRAVAPKAAPSAVMSAEGVESKAGEARRDEGAADAVPLVEVLQSAPRENLQDARVPEGAARATAAPPTRIGGMYVDATPSPLDPGVVIVVAGELEAGYRLVVEAAGGDASSRRDAVPVVQGADGVQSASIAAARFGDARLLGPGGGPEMRITRAHARFEAAPVRTRVAVLGALLDATETVAQGRSERAARLSRLEEAAAAVVQSAPGDPGAVAMLARIRAAREAAGSGQ